MFAKSLGQIEHKGLSYTMCLRTDCSLLCDSLGASFPLWTQHFRSGLPGAKENVPVPRTWIQIWTTNCSNCSLWSS